MQWGPALELGHAGIDADHRSLLETLNRLRQAVRQDQGREEIQAVLLFLRDYTVSHFATEEGLMLQHGYPGTSAHLTAHADLVMQLSDLVADYRAGKAQLTEALLTFLEAWLVEHIQGLDREFGWYLRGRGLAS
ncbi:MAG: bacteriohemerythrin [Holophagaceae bacterium]|nr:bacteriohemerythrin [Holophagaceae bacterium]